MYNIFHYDNSKKISAKIRGIILEVILPGGKIKDDKYLIEEDGALLPIFIVDTKTGKWEDRNTGRRGNNITELFIYKHSGPEEGILRNFNGIFRESLHGLAPTPDNDEIPF